MAMLVFFDIEEITAVPLPPHPIMPMRIAELALEPKAMLGLNIVAAEITAVFFTNILLSII